MEKFGSDYPIFEKLSPNAVDTESALFIYEQRNDTHKLL